MNMEEFIAKLESYDLWIILALVLAPPILVLVMRLLHRNQYGGDNPWRYIYSLLIYWVSLPGVLAGVLTAYTLFFVRQNLLQVNVVIYFLPILSMIATLVLVRRKVDWDDLPGVDRLMAFITLIAISLIVALAILKTRIWIIFGGSIFMLLIIALICYVLLKASFNTLTRGKNRKNPGSPYDAAINKARQKRRAEAEMKKMRRKVKID